MKISDNDYYSSPEFLEILYEYENAESNGEPVFMDSDDLTDIADYYKFLGKKEKALDIIRQAAETFPDAIGPKLFMGHHSIEEGDLVKARQYDESIVDTGDIDYSYLHMRLLLAEHKYAEAHRFAFSAVSELDDNDHDDLLEDFASLYSEYDLDDEAMLLLSFVFDKNRTSVRMALAYCQAAQEHFDEAERMMNELIDSDAFNIDFWLGLATVQMMAGKIDDAITSCDYALAIDSNDNNAKAIKAECMANLDFDENIDEDIDEDFDK